RGEGGGGSMAAKTWWMAIRACSKAVIIAGRIAVIAPVGVIGPPRASIPIAHVAHALAQREIARRGGEIADGHRRCRRRHDAAERSASDQPDRESFHGTPPYCCCTSRNSAPTPNRRRRLLSRLSMASSR